MKHKLTIGVSNKSPKSRVVTYKKVSPFEKWILKKLDLEKELKEVEAEYEAKSIELTDFISSKISDEKTMMIVLYRDVSNKPYEDISKIVNLSLSYVYKLHKDGIEELLKA